jgi:ABC-type transporter MlaC component
MITEKSTFQETHFILMPEKKLNKKIISELIAKITAKQKEPFAKIYVTVHPMFYAPLMMALKNQKIDIKGLFSDKNVFVIQL